MTFSELLNQAIARLEGYEEKFTIETLSDGRRAMWDAELDAIPDYCTILGVQGALQFYDGLTKISDAKV